MNLICSACGRPLDDGEINCAPAYVPRHGTTEPAPEAFRPWEQDWPGPQEPAPDLTLVDWVLPPECPDF